MLSLSREQAGELLKVDQHPQADHPGGRPGSHRGAAFRRRHRGRAADGPPGAAAPDGTRVSAEVNGVEAKTGTTREGKYGYDTGDLFRVDGAAADEVVFKVNGVPAEETGVFKNGGSTELNLSAAQTAVDPLVARYDANGNGTIEKNEVIVAINDYLFGEGDAAISKSGVIRLINLYLFG